MKCPYCNKDNTLIIRNTVLKYFNIDKIESDGSFSIGKTLDNSNYDITIDSNIQCNKCEKILQERDYHLKLLKFGYLILKENDLKRNKEILNA